MRPALIVFAALTLCGCVRDQVSPQQTAAVSAQEASYRQLALSHKITWVEEAKRSNAAVLRVLQRPLTPSEQLMLSYRIALASEVDRGAMTVEVADFRLQSYVAQKSAEDNAREEQQETAISNGIANGLGAYSQAMTTASQQQLAHQSFNCTSTPSGNQIRTDCY